MEKAMGLIETLGYVGAVEALDAALKTAQVSLVGMEQATGALVTIVLEGDVAAVKAACDAGGEAAKRVGTLVSCHVIPRPYPGVRDLVETEEDQPSDDPIPPEGGADPEEPITNENEETPERQKTSPYGEIRVVDLRKLAREREIDTMDRSQIKYAKRDELIEALEAFDKKGGTS